MAAVKRTIMGMTTGVGCGLGGMLAILPCAGTGCAACFGCAGVGVGLVLMLAAREFWRQSRFNPETANKEANRDHG